MSWRDDWPSGPDGSPYDGKKLMELVFSNQSPPRGLWNVRQLLQEIEENLNIKVIDIPIVNRGSNKYVSTGLKHFESSKP